MRTLRSMFRVIRFVLFQLAGIAAGTALGILLLSLKSDNDVIQLLQLAAACALAVLGWGIGCWFAFRHFRVRLPVFKRH